MGGKRRGRKGEEKREEKGKKAGDHSSLRWGKKKREEGEEKREEKGKRGKFEEKKISVECLVMNEVILVSNQIHVDAEERENYILTD